MKCSNNNTHIVIMAGGGGTRFWPLSRNDNPKQFLQLINDKSMLRNTFERIDSFVQPSQVWIVTNHLYRDFIANDIPEIPLSNILVEPLRRDTAAAIMLASGVIHAQDKNATMVVMPADHVISPNENFIKSIQSACSIAQDKLITFGILPTYPSPQFGYIKTKDGNKDILEVDAFVEKPTVSIARNYLEQGNYYWNSGIFIWKTVTIMQQLQSYLPQHYDGAIKLQKDWNSTQWETTLETVFSKIPSVSIDYGVMEKATNVVLIKATFKWNDVGNWEALEQIHAQSENTAIGKHIALDSNGCIIHSQKHLVATIGINDVVVVTTDDAVLVVPKTKTSQVKDLVKMLKKENKTTYL